jgi:2-keto-4-pentenoate hydratase/2-oxohepta-3-ene-1,7-dioic acid hydratase in catechol pathway
MKLVRYSTRGSSPRLGALVGDRIRCLGETYHRYLAGRGVVRAGELAHALFPPSAREFLRAGPAAEDALHAMESAAKSGKLEWMTHPVAEAHLHAPIHDPEKFICIGLNYIDHAEETKSPIPKEPPLFAKFPNSIVDATAPIVRPKGCEKLDYEVELGFVVGPRPRTFPPSARSTTSGATWSSTT